MNFVHFAFHHHDVVKRSTHHNINICFFQFRERRVDYILTIDTCDAAFRALPAKFYPVVVSAAWLAFFAGSLAGTPAVERFARMKTPDLPPSAVRYCRRVTVAWCVFFLANGTVALDSALNRSDAWWALYNGLICYIAMGLMFAGEYAVRLWVRRNQR